MANLPDLFRRNRSLFSDLFHDLDNFFGSSGSSLPRMSEMSADMMKLDYDIDENEQSYFLTFDIPGIRPEDLKIDVTDNMLTITGERKQEWSEGKQNISRRYGRVQQSLMLPTGTSADAIEAHCENGVLEVVIPKTEGIRSRSIGVRTGRALRGEAQKSPEESKKAQTDSGRSANQSTSSTAKH